jgi:hypothetical protein
MKRSGVTAFAAMAQFARQNVRFGHRQERTFARHEGDTGRGVARPLVQRSIRIWLARSK